jgi:hypothetical protein
MRYGLTCMQLSNVVLFRSLTARRRPRTISASVISRSEWARATWCGVLPVTRECSLVSPRPLGVDVPDPVAEEGPVKGKSTEGSYDQDREQRPCHAFDGSPPNRHSLEVVMLWGHKAPLCHSYASSEKPFRGQQAVAVESIRTVADFGCVTGVDASVVTGSERARRDSNPQPSDP